MSDSIGDFLTIIRNASRAGKEKCIGRYSKLLEQVSSILKSEGYIRDYAVIEERPGIKRIQVVLKYVNEVPAITGIQRVSKPGRRIYYKYNDIPRTLGGLGISIVTTSRGVIKDSEARRQKAGGEIICTVW